jgi:hypothetical protein
MPGELSFLRAYLHEPNADECPSRERTMTIGLGPITGTVAAPTEKARNVTRWS